MSPLTSRRSVRPGLDNRFLLGGLSSGSRLLREGRADRHHIGGQDVEFTLYRCLLLPYCIFEFGFKLPLCFELCRLYLKLLCKTCVVN